MASHLTGKDDIYAIHKDDMYPNLPAIMSRTATEKRLKIFFYDDRRRIKIFLK